jgi:hypothetical protein
LKIALGDAERQIKNYIGYPVGIEYIEKETHNLPNMSTTVRLNYDKVLATGTKTKTRVGESLPITKTFSDPDGGGFNTCITYTIGNGITDLGIINTNSLEIYQADYDLKEGNRLRPFEAELNQDNTLLTITLPVEVAINYKLYSKLPTKTANGIKALDLCDVNNYPDNITIYKVSFEKPDGVLRYPKHKCTCDNNTCDACQLDEILICLEPVHPEMGIFRTHPIENTEIDPLLPPCWEHTKNLYNCCSAYSYDGFHYHYHYDNITCLVDKPVEIEVNYLAGCNGKYGDANFIDDVCLDLRKAVCALAVSNLKKVCDCGCVEELFKEYQMELTFLSIKNRVANITSHDTIFGGKWGAVVAKRALQFITKRIKYAEVYG